MMLRMPFLPTLVRGRVSRFLCFVLVALVASILHAQTWQGTGTNWSDSTDWSSTLANDGTAAVVFSSTGNTTSTVDAAWSINSLTFSSTAQIYTIGGTGTL